MSINDTKRPAANQTPCPRYLAAFADQWATGPHAANMAWWKQAGWGMFLHYGLYSQLGRHEWVQYRENIPVSTYDKLANTFDPSKFNADAITDLACEAGMTYVNLTTCHHEGFCLWDSPSEPFNSMNHGGRDLVNELAEQCDKKGLGFFAYFTHLINWRHPHALPRDRMGMTRPDYPADQSPYAPKNDPAAYWAWAHTCMRELCAIKHPLAGVWLDIIRAYYLQPELVPIEDTYALIRKHRPEALISFKQGATGTEDYASPEYHFRSQGDQLRNEGKPEAGAIADRAWNANKVKYNEICLSLQKNGWGYVKDSAYMNTDAVWDALQYAKSNRCNLLANIAPLPDGSLHPDAIATLRSVGQRIRREGFPAGDQAVAAPQQARQGVTAAE